MIKDFMTPWLKSGFMTVLNWMDNLILRHELSDDTASINVKVSS